MIQLKLKIRCGPELKSGEHPPQSPFGKGEDNSPSRKYSGPSVAKGRHRGVFILGIVKMMKQ